MQIRKDPYNRIKIKVEEFSNKNRYTTYIEGIRNYKAFVLIPSNKKGIYSYMIVEEKDLLGKSIAKIIYKGKERNVVILDSGNYTHDIYYKKRTHIFVTYDLDKKDMRFFEFDKIMKFERVGIYEGKNKTIIENVKK